MNLNKRFSLAYNPWLYFPVFLFTNLLLSYFPFPLETKITLFLLGIAVPMLAALASISPAGDDEKPVFHQDLFRMLPWIWQVVLVAAVLLRVYKLQGLSVWPMMDEGRVSFFAMRLDHQWSWKLLYGYSQLPPFFYWALAGFFKLFPPSLLDLWLFPAVISALLLPLGYWAARPLFSRSFSFLCLVLLSFGFWPLYAGRFAVEGIMVLFWLFLTLPFLSRYVTAQPVPSKKLTLALGVLIGLGFYVHLHWPIIAAVMILAVLRRQLRDGFPPNRLWLFFAPILILPIPLAVAALGQGYGSYMQSLFVSDIQHPLGNRIFTSFSYITALFWGVDNELYAYKPIWGGFLNPILGSCFFIGLLEFHRFRKRWFARWAGIAFLLFLIPGFLTNNLELFRIIQVLPILLVGTAVGLAVLITRFPGDKRSRVAVALLLPAIFLDIYHMTGPYHQCWTKEYGHWAVYSKSREQWTEYQILQDLDQREGPGYIFGEFDAYPFDRSLAVAAHPFEASGTQPEWAAFPANVNYRPFLEKRFPDAKWIALTPPGKEMDGGLMLGIVPVTEGNLPVFEKWKIANDRLKEMTYEMLNRPWVHSRQEILRGMFKAYPDFQGDPFLESIFWDLVYLNYSSDQDYKDSYFSLTMALAKGYRTAYFYNELGGLLYTQKDYKDAKSAFEMALQSPPNQTPAAENLEMLKKLESQNGSIR